MGMRTNDKLGGILGGATTGTDVEQDDGSIKRGLDVELLDKVIEIDSNTKSQQQINATLQNMAEILLRIEFLIKSGGE